MTPLLLVAGFLGAGKTTFLRALLPALKAHGLRCHVLLNDFQNARVDGATLADLASAVVAVDGACLCCETLDDLLGALATAPTDPGNVIVVETNGTTDTAVLLTMVSEDASLERLTLPLQLTVVDLHRFGRRQWQNAMERDQIVTATHLALSRIDEVDPDRRAEVDRALHDLVPDARWTDAETLAGELAALAASVRALPGRRGPSAARPVAPWTFAGETGHAAVHHFASLKVPLPAPVDSHAFATFLAELPAEVLRAKGIVALRDLGGERRTFQKVDRDVEISPCQLADPDATEPEAIFIGPRIPEALVRERLALLLDDRPPLAPGAPR